MSAGGQRYDEWSDWAWNGQRRQWERTLMSSTGEIRTQYGQLPAPPAPQVEPPAQADWPRYVRQPEFARQVFPSNPSWERGQSGYTTAQPAQPSRYYPPLSSQRYNTPVRGAYANLGSNELTPELYNAEDTAPNESIGSPQPAPAVGRRPSEHRDDEENQSQSSYGSRAQTPRAADRPSPAVDTSQVRRDNGNENSTAIEDDDSPVNDATKKFTDLSLTTRARRPSKSYHPEPRSNPRPPISRNQSSKGDSRSQSGASRTRRPERTLSQSAGERPQLMLQQGGQENRSSESASSKKARKRQSMIQQVVQPRQEQNDSNRRDRKNSSAQVRPDMKELALDLQTPSRNFGPSKKKELQRAPYLDPQQRGVLLPKWSNSSTLDTDFQLCGSRQFSMGSVFMTLWSEPMGISSEVSADQVYYTTPSKYGESAYHSIRRFAIVSAREGHCLCLPILTYGGQATAKRGVKAEDHAIIYIGGDDMIPVELPSEKPLRKRPIRVVGKSRRDMLLPASRINYSKVYTIEHDFKVCFIGKIHKDSEAEFFATYRRTNDPH